jgi:hypothetical protein
MLIARVFPWRPLSGRVACAVTALCAAFASGCYTDSDGLDPPRDALYYPTNLVVSPGRKVLYVTNSDFDLQYNGGTVQALDLVALRERAVALQAALDTDIGAAACADPTVGLGPNPDPNLNPGPCSPVGVEPFVKASRTIGAFSSGAVLVSHPEQSMARLFVSVRGDPSITFFDISDDRSPEALGATCGGSPFCLLCEASGPSERCGSGHRAGEIESESKRGLVLPVEPIGIAVDGRGEAIVTAHQTEQAASLVINKWGEKPTLEHIITNLPFSPTEVAALPEPGVVRASGGAVAWQPGFLVTFRDAAEIDLLRYDDDGGSSASRPFLTRASLANITVNSIGTESIGVAVDGSRRQACEAACDASSAEPGGEPLIACMRDCAAIPLRLFIANRTPASLLTGEIRTSIAEQDGKIIAAYDDIQIQSTFPLARGASRAAIGRVIGEDGELHVRVFVLAFDSRFVFVYDPDAMRVEAVIRTGRGPQALAFDTGGSGTPEDPRRSFLYVGHFTDSYIGVVDLDMRKPRTFGSMFLTVGVPVPPKESQ